MFLIDNNLSYRIASILRTNFSGIVHISDIQLKANDDLSIWNYAKSKNLHILTKDKDFNDIQLTEGYPPKIVWIKIGNVSTNRIIQLLILNEMKIKEFLSNPEFGILQIQ
jgi:predicted nuclease of predicted toxin-antitoxin system